MSQARELILVEIAMHEGIDFDVVCDACSWIENTTLLGLVAQQIRAGRIGIFERTLRVAPWVDTKTLDAKSLSAVKAVAMAGMPRDLLRQSVDMVLRCV